MSIRFKILLSLLMVAGSVHAQLPIPRGSSSITAQDANLHVLNNFKIPTAVDTAHALKGLDSLGLLVYIRSTGEIYKRDTATGGHKWTLFGSGSSGTDSAIAHGYGIAAISISGTTRYIAVDTNLITSLLSRKKLADSIGAILATKLNISDTTGKWISRIYRSHDSVYACKNTTCVLAFIDSTGSSGSDTSYFRSPGTGQQPFNISTVSNITAITLLKHRDSLDHHSVLAPDSVIVDYVDMSGKKDKADSVAPTGYASHGRVAKVADSLSTVFNSSLAAKKDKSDSTTATSYVPRNQIDSMRQALYNAIGVRIINGGNAASITANPIAMRPAASNCKCFFASTDTWKWYYDNGAWNEIKTVQGLLAGHILMGDKNGNGVDTTFVLDVPTYPALPEVKLNIPALGVAASASRTNYLPTSIDSVQYQFSTTGAGTAGTTEFGGWLANSTSGDSVQVTAPFCVVIGDSQAEGHGSPTGLHGRLHPYIAGIPTNGYIYNYPDTVGQLSYHLRLLTMMRWYNQGIGGQTSTQIRNRFLRDVFGLTSSVSDGRPNNTISQLPACVVIIAGINDVPANITATMTEANLEWMASQCLQRGVKCVVLNLPGDALANQAMLKALNDVNLWLKNGALNKYGCSVVDYNTWWRGTANNDISPNSLISDDIHPSKVGYDSLAHVIFRQANLPILKSVIFINEIAPAFSGYSRPANITINGWAATIAKSTDTIPIVAYVPDSVWIKVISSTNVSGTSFSGFSHILWQLDNNPNNSIYYTKTIPFNGATKVNQDISYLKVTAPDFTAGDLFDVNFADGQSVFKLTKGATSTGTVNATMTFNQTGTFTGSGGTFPLTTSTTNVGNRFGVSQIGASQRATSLGYGLNAVGGVYFLDYSLGYANNTGLQLSPYFSGTGANITNNAGHCEGVRIQHSALQFLGHDDSAYQLRIDPFINDTIGNQNNQFWGMLNLEPNIINPGAAVIVGIMETRGVNHFNKLGERTIIGPSGSHRSAILEVNATRQGLMIPSMSTGARDSIGYLKSGSVTGGSWTVAPKIVLTGGTGSGVRVACYTNSGLQIQVIDGGIGYGPSGTGVTASFVGGTGSGGTINLVWSGADTGLLINNTTTGTLQRFNGVSWDDIATGGTSAGFQAPLHLVNDADYTIAAGVENVIYHATLTANRAVTLPDATTSTNRHIRIFAKNVGAFQLSMTSVSQIFLTGTSSSTTQVTNISGSVWDYQSDGTSWYLTGYAHP